MAHEGAPTVDGGDVVALAELPQDLADDGTADAVLGREVSLTGLRLGVPPTLARTLRSTNAIESMIGVCRQRSANVKRWRDGNMALHWCAAGVVEAGKQFRRVNGHMHLPTLRAAHERHVAEQSVCADHHDEIVNVA